MKNLLPHNRVQVPNGLAIFAAVLLLISSVLGFEANQEKYSSGQETISSAKIESTDNDHGDSVKATRSRGLNLGLLLFRRG